MNELGKRLAELRLGRRLSLREAARRIGISETRLRDFERGERAGYVAIPKRPVLLKMASTYQYPQEALLLLAGMPVEVHPAPVPDAADLEALEAADLIRRLSDSERATVMAMLRALRPVVEN
ncbi:MAG: helix-turn-helix transcriptional regulator [bacterium]|nr:helix-turn-helix transcriptional regulator [bacterium]